MNQPQQWTRETMIGPFPLPQVDDAMRADAATKSDEWIAFVDPVVREGEDPPKLAVQGGYHVDENGRLSGRYHINPGYKPSVARAGFDFAASIELTLWRVLNGYNPLGILADSFYHADLMCYAEYEGDTRMPVMADPNQPGVSFFPVCTSPQFNTWRYTHTVRGNIIYQIMGNSQVVLDINPGTSLSMRISASLLAGLINEKTPHLLEIIRNKQQG